MLIVNVTRLLLYVLLGLVFYLDVPLRYWGLPAIILHDWQWYVPFIYNRKVIAMLGGGGQGLPLPKSSIIETPKKEEDIKWN